MAEQHTYPDKYALDRDTPALIMAQELRALAFRLYTPRDRALLSRAAAHIEEMEGILADVQNDKV